MLFAMTRLRLVGALLIGATLAVLLALVAFSPAAQANHSWGGYHWARTSNPFTVKVGDNVSTAWDPYLDTALSDPSVNDWRDSSVLDAQEALGGVTRVKRCPPTSGRVEVCNALYGNNGWLGLAQIWLSGKHITQGVTKMNDTYFNTAKYNTPAWRHLVMCQEIGHTFGLDHQDENFSNPNLETCMDYTNDPDGTRADPDQKSNEYPNTHDYEELVTIYTHLDGSTTVGTNAASKMPPAANQGAFNSRAEWGHKLRESGGGHLELWERSFGGGAKLITWVIRP